MRHIRRWVTEEVGQDLLEYAFLVALIALVAVIGVIALGGPVQQLYSQIIAGIS